jgi:hypothetical protein
MMLQQLERVPWVVWVLVTIAVLGMGWGAWSRYCCDSGDVNWLDPKQAPQGIVLPPITMVPVGGGGTLHGSGYPSPVMKTRAFPPTLAEWETSFIRANFSTPGVI